MNSASRSVSRPRNLLQPGELTSHGALVFSYGGIVRALITLVPLWWVLGIDVFVWPLALIAIFVCARPRIWWGNPYWFPVPLFAAYAVLRLAFPPAAQFQWDLSRLLAASYNLGLAVTANFLFYAVYRYSDQRQFDNDVQRPLARLGAALLFLYPTLFCLSFLFPQCLITHPTLLGTLVTQELPGILDNAMNATYVRAEWGSGSLVGRVLVFSPYPTCAALVVVITYCCWELRSRGRSFWTAMLGEIGIVVALLTTWSRATVAAFLAGTAIKYYFCLRPGSPLRYFMILAGVGGAAVFMAASDSPLDSITGIFDEGTSYRSNSTATRMESYKMAYDITMEASPAFGLGFKPSDQSVLKIPIGSHSSVVSTFIKFGAVGLGLFLAFNYILPALGWLKLLAASQPRLDPATWSLFRMQITCWGWMVFDDFDAFAFPCFLLAVALLLVHRHFAKWQPAMKGA